MKKHCFYLIYCCNNFIEIHNSIFSKILSNPFFDDAQFYFTVISDTESWVGGGRLLMPRITPFFSKSTNVGSESPAFLMMSEYQNRIEEDDAVFYFHCKGSSKSGIKNVTNYQDSLLSKHAIKIWTDCMSIFLIDKIQDYISFLNVYGSICVYPIRHAFSNQEIAGSLGNFWWCRGSVAKMIQMIDLNKNRHYFEIELLKQLLQLSKNEYKSSFYIHDGELSMYDLDSQSIKDCVYGYYNKSLIDLINMDLTLDKENPTICIITDGSSTTDKDFKIKQRFQNYIIRNSNQKKVKSLINIYMRECDLEHPYPSHWLDNFAKRIYTSFIDDVNYVFNLDGFKIEKGDKYEIA